MIGDRIRRYRTAQGMYLADVAAEVGISTGQLSRLERGERRLTDRTLVVELTRVLGCSPPELLGHPVDWTDPALVDAQASVASLRIALASTQLGVPAGSEARPVDQLEQATARVVELRSAVELAAMGAMLPELVTELHTRVADSAGDERARALRALVVVCNSAMTLAHASGYAMEAHVAAQRSQQAAAELGPAWEAVSAFTAAHALLAMGGHELAHTTASDAADAARGLDGMVGGQPSPAAYGSLLLASALTASITGREGESADRLVEAADVAEQTGECSPLVATFGPTNCGIYSMTSALERGDHAAAVSLARPVDPSVLQSERRAKFHIDYARALTGAGHDEQAIVACYRAERQSRQRLYGNPYARQTVSVLRDRAPGGEPGRNLRELAQRMNLAS